jgi:hypothetical protein
MPQLTQTPPDSKVFTVKELYEKSSPLVVPQWQRDFSWQPDDHVQKLIEDLWEFSEGATTNPSRYYLLGQVIFVPNSQAQNEIVDGQQRLTAVYLLLLSLLNAFKSPERVDITDQSNSIIFANLINAIIDDEDHDVRLVLPFQDGTKVIRHLYNSGPNDRSQLGFELTQSQQNLLDVYDHFASWVDEQLPDEESLTAYTKRILQMVYFTRLVISDIPQAMDYFEKMNRRGLPLDAADLLKNYLFSQVEEADFGALTNSWRTMSTEVQKIKKRSLGSTEMFIKTWAVSKRFQKINGTEALLTYWKNELATQERRDSFIDLLQDKSRLYRNMAEGNLEASPHPVLECVRSLSGSQHLPVLLAGSHLNQFHYLCGLVDRRFTLYAFANERTGAFESVIPKWCEQVSSLPANASKEQILSASRLADGFIRPDAKTAVTSFIEGLNYRKVANHRKLRFVLAMTARHLDILAKADYHGQPFEFYLKTARRNSPGFDMDHVLGQQYLHEKTDEEKGIFNSIGALTPLFSSAHREDTHLKPAQKSGLYQESPFVLTKSLSSIPATASPRLRRVLEEIRATAPVELQNWDRESVLIRTEFIIKKFLDAIEVDDFLPE